MYFSFPLAGPGQASGSHRREDATVKVAAIASLPPSQYPTVSVDCVVRGMDTLSSALAVSVVLVLFAVYWRSRGHDPPANQSVPISMSSSSDASAGPGHRCMYGTHSRCPFIDPFIEKHSLVRTNRCAHSYARTQNRDVFLLL